MFECSKKKKRDTFLAFGRGHAKASHRVVTMTSSLSFSRPNVITINWLNVSSCQLRAIPPQVTLFAEQLQKFKAENNEISDISILPRLVELRELMLVQLLLLFVCLFFFFYLLRFVCKALTPPAPVRTTTKSTRLWSRAAPAASSCRCQSFSTKFTCATTCWRRSTQHSAPYVAPAARAWLTCVVRAAAVPARTLPVVQRAHGAARRCVCAPRRLAERRALQPLAS